MEKVTKEVVPQEFNYTLRVTQKFDSAHKLNNYVGRCAHLHGHTWRFEVFVLVPKLQEKVEFGIDFKVMKATIEKTVTNKLDHAYLNDIVEQPTAENLSVYIFNTLDAVFKKKFGARVVRVDLWETENACVTLTSK
jgi:6-pyruvoyltetrahydropterin/6-carboxytetrahydropterin synthase